MLSEGEQMEKEYYVCTGCGLLCEDIETELEKRAISKVYTACRVGVAHMKENPGTAKFWVEGKNTDEATAIGKAAALLKAAKNPLIFGLDNSTNEAQKKAIELAKKLNATLDDSSSFSFGPLMAALLQKKFKTCSLDEVRDKADVSVFWGADPSDSHPRQLSKFAYFPRGKEKQRGWEEERTAIAIDIRKTHTAKICGNEFYQVPLGGDAEFMEALIAGLSGKLPKTSYKYPPKKLLELANLLKAAKFGVIFIGQDLLYSLETLAPLFRLMDTLNEKAKGDFFLIPLLEAYNMRGFNENLFEETGFVNRVKFEAGSVKHGPEYSVVESLKAKAVDAALIIGSDPLANLPYSIIKELLEIPLITIDPCETLTSKKAQVSIRSGVSGVEAGGSALRIDGVRVAFKPVFESKCPSDEEILLKIMEAF